MSGQREAHPQPATDPRRGGAIDGDQRAAHERIMCRSSYLDADLLENVTPVQSSG